VGGWREGPYVRGDALDSITASRIELGGRRVLISTRFDDDLVTQIDDILPVVDVVRFESGSPPRPA
jgi:hypothetical protein